MRNIPEEKLRYEGTNVPPPGADQLEGIHFEVSSEPVEKLSEKVGPLACNVPWATKTVANTKTIIFVIEFSLVYKEWGLADQSLCGQRDSGAQDNFSFAFTECKDLSRRVQRNAQRVSVDERMPGTDRSHFL